MSRNPDEPRCAGCGKPIIFAHITRTDGKPGVIPLDARAPVYEVHTDEFGERFGKRMTTAFVSHFATCPKANDFGGGRARAVTNGTPRPGEAPPVPAAGSGVGALQDPIADPGMRGTGRADQ
jgi:hypothetical protein